MADPISVQCPHCKVKLKLKAAPPAGKKIGCPKCKKPFPMKAPAKKKESDDDFLDALDDLAEDDYKAPEDEDSQDEEEDAPPARSFDAVEGGCLDEEGCEGEERPLEEEFRRADLGDHRRQCGGACVDWRLGLSADEPAGWSKRDSQRVG